MRSNWAHKSVVPILMPQSAWIQLTNLSSPQCISKLLTVINCVIGAKNKMLTMFLVMDIAYFIKQRR
mgnify:CR=1 FL=1